MQIKGHKSVFALNAFRVLLLLFVFDYATGAFMERLYLKQRSGKYYRITHSIEETRADVLIFGSSHAIRHVVPDRISETLGMSCYNSGVQGKGILFTSALQSLILERYTPRMMILVIDADMLYESEVQYDRLGDLLPYYKTHRSVLEPFVALKSRFEKVKLLSRTYPYNSTIVHIARYWIAPQKDYNGYRPLYGNMPPSLIERFSAPAPEPLRRPVQKKRLDDTFVAALNDFIEKARGAGAGIAFVISPMYLTADLGANESYARITEIAADHAVPIFDYSSDPRFLGRHSLFRDEGHLNNEGALLFSSLAAGELKLVPAGPPSPPGAR